MHLKIVLIFKVSYFYISGFFILRKSAEKMTLGYIIDKINYLLPPKTAMSNDRLGLQVEGSSDDIRKVLVTLEVTEEVIGEAIKNSCNMIITFHPLIWQPLLSVNLSERVGFLLSSLLKNSISLISVHTTFDAYLEGTSRIISNIMEMKYLDFLKKYDENAEYGIGVIAEYETPISETEFLNNSAKLFGKNLRYTQGKNKLIKRVAIVGGSGSEFMDEALKSKCDAFITADLTYHQFHKAKNNIMLVDAGHYEMEQFVPNGLTNLFRKAFSDEIEFICSEVNTNPVKYF